MRIDGQIVRDPKVTERSSARDRCGTDRQTSEQYRVVVAIGLAFDSVEHADNNTTMRKNFFIECFLREDQRIERRGS